MSCLLEIENSIGENRVKDYFKEIQKNLNKEKGAKRLLCLCRVLEGFAIFGHYILLCIDKHLVNAFSQQNKPLYMT